MTDEREEKKIDDDANTPATMQALVFQGVNKKPKLETRPRPIVHEATDIVIRVHKTTVCGTDLHILTGNVPTCKPGRILGHEGIGHVVARGAAVHKWQLGDRVLVSCITACGNCPACLSHRYAFCQNGGWQFGNTIDGMQAEYCRIPHADSTCHALPASVPASVEAEDPYVMVSDILPTGYEIGLRCCEGLPDSASVAIVGAGPVGLAALIAIVAKDRERRHKSIIEVKRAAKQATEPQQHPLPNPNPTSRRIFAIDRDPHRLDMAAKMGATDLVNNVQGDAIDQIMRLTNNEGVDFVVECIGLPVGWNISQGIISRGGQMTILGVHGQSASIDLAKLWQHNVSIHTGMVHCHTIPMFMNLIEQGLLPEATQLISHRFPMSQLEHAYDHFQNAASTHSLKVLIRNDLS